MNYKIVNLTTGRTISEYSSLALALSARESLARFVPKSAELFIYFPGETYSA